MQKPLPVVLDMGLKKKIECTEIKPQPFFFYKVHVSLFLVINSSFFNLDHTLLGFPFFFLEKKN